MISSKIKAVRNLKNTIVLILSFSLSKVDECTCRVLWPLYDFYQKSGLTQSWMGNLRPQKILDWPLILSEVSHCPTCCSPTASGGHCAPPLGSPWPPKRSKTMHKSIWRVFLWGCSLQNQRQLTSLLLICSTLYGKGIEERRPATRRRAAASSGGGAHWWLLSLKKVS